MVEQIMPPKYLPANVKQLEKEYKIMLNDD